LAHCWVHSHTEFESVTSTKKVSCSAFALLARESVIFTTKVSCNTFTLLVCEPITLTIHIKQDKSTPTFQLVVASVSNNNALSFDDKSSAMFKLVVASVTNEFSKGSTNDSPAKQRPIPNDGPAIENNLQLHVPMIVASIWKLIVALTYKESIKTYPIFSLIDVSIPNKNDLCSAFQMVAHGHNTFINSTSFNNSSFQLVVKFSLISNSEGA
jgi:hypothetical protein